MVENPLQSSKLTMWTLNITVTVSFHSQSTTRMRPKTSRYAAVWILRAVWVPESFQLFSMKYRSAEREADLNRVKQSAVVSHICHCFYESNERSSILLSRTNYNTNMYLLAHVRQCRHLGGRLFRFKPCRFESIIVFHCKDTQAVELEEQVALAACSGRAEWFRRQASTHASY